MKLSAQLHLFFHNYLSPLLRETGIILHEFTYALIASLSKDNMKKYQAEFTHAGELLSESNQGFCLDGRRQLSSIHSHRNALIVAPSGMGKSTVVAIPFILKANSSMVINDPSKELFEKTSGHLHSQGYDIRIVNFANPENSNGFNPLARIENASDCNKIAFMLVRSVLGSTGDPFWRLQSTSLIAIIIQVLQNEEVQYRNLANVRHLLNLLSIQPAKMDKIVARTNMAQLINEYKQFLTYDVKVQSGIIATCLAALQIFTDNTVAHVTSSDTIQFAELRHHKTAIFIHSNINDLKYYSVLISILFEQVTKTIMNKLPDKKDLDVHFVLDELSSLYLPTLQIITANIRKYRAGLLFFLQDYQQLIDIYGRQEAESIRSNTFAKVYFGGQSHPTAVEISQLLGKYEVEDEKGNRRIVELKTADEVRMLSNEQAILIAANYKPILLNLRPYYNNPFLKLKTELIPPILNGLASGQVSLLND
jgi:type IV secretion system protein VirD4